MKKYLLTISILLIFLAVTVFVIINQRAKLEGRPVVGEQTQNSEANDGAGEAIIATDSNMEIKKDKNYIAVLDTSVGEIKIELFASVTPITVNNFVSLARKNFYNGTIFHRVIKGFMIQGGDPRGDGSGGPGYVFDDEPFQGEYLRGTVAMANAGPNTNGSQFFIMHQDYPLDKNYVIFGRVVNGLETVDKIVGAPVEPSLSGEPSRPVNPAMVEKVEIIEE